jgi:hypothetical protein
LSSQLKGWVDSLVNSKRPGVLIVLPTAAGVANPTAPSADKGRDKSILVKTVEKEFDDCEIVPFSRNNYNELAGKRSPLFAT